MSILYLMTSLVLFYVTNTLLRGVRKGIKCEGETPALGAGSRVQRTLMCNPDVCMEARCLHSGCHN